MRCKKKKKSTVDAEGMNRDLQNKIKKCNLIQLCLYST